MARVRIVFTHSWSSVCWSVTVLIGLPTTLHGGGLLPPARPFGEDAERVRADLGAYRAAHLRPLRADPARRSLPGADGGGRARPRPVRGAGGVERQLHRPRGRG